MIGIGQKTFEGAVWTVGFTIFIKILTSLTQIILAWLLVPTDFGLFAMTLSITNIATIFAGGQVRTILIQNQDQFNSKVSDGFWLGLFLNVIIGLLLISLAPVAAKIYNNERIINLLYIVALSIPIRALSIIYSSKLNIDLRYKTLVKLHFLEAAVLNFSTIILALLNFGVYALVIPYLLSSTTTAISTRIVVGKIKIYKPKISEWKLLISNFSLLVLYNLFLSLQFDGINLFVGIIHGPEVTGLFFWGYNLAVQAIFIFTLRLKDIFFPTFTKYKDEPAERYKVFRKILTYLIIISVPVFCLQIILAPTFIKLLFNEKWYGAIEVIQWISLIILVKPFNVLLDSVLLALGKNKLLLTLTFIVTLIVISSAFAGSILGLQVSVARWLSIAVVVTGIAQGLTGYILLKGNIPDFISDFKSLLLILLLMLSITWLSFTIGSKINDVFAIFVSILMNLTFYIFILKKIKSDFIEEIINRTGHRNFFVKLKLVR